MITTRLVTAYRRLGLLLWLALGAFLSAVLVHHYSRLPASYTWFEPLWALQNVVRLPHFPLAVVATYALGAWAFRGSWDLEQSARVLASTLPARDWLPRTLKPLAAIALVVLVDALVIGSERDVLDLLALVAIGFLLARLWPDRQQMGRALGHGVLSALVFLVVCYCYTIVKALTFASGRGFDAAIIGIESALFGAPPHRALALWTATHPSFAALCDWVYFHFFEHMALTTVLLVALRLRAQRTEYLAALALCYLMGGPLYHVFPAFGPSYFEPRYFEFLQDKALLTGAIRRYLQLNTYGVLNGTARQVRTWSYIACMPSLHVAHELVSLYYVRSCLPAFVISLLFALLTMLSVVALGWHYPLDSVFGALLGVLAIALARSQRLFLMPPELRSFDEVPPPGKPVIVPFLKAYWAARRSGAEP